MLTIYALRHLKTQDNLDQRFGSAERDIPILRGQTVTLTAQDNAMLQAQNLVIAHTGMIRTVQTAKLIAQALHWTGQMAEVPELRERFGGQLAGMSFPAIQQHFSQLDTPNQLWQIDADEFNLESAQAFLTRIKEGIDQLKDLAQEGQGVLLVAHAGTIKGIRACLEAHTLESQRAILMQPTPNNGQLHRFTIG